MKKMFYGSVLLAVMMGLNLKAEVVNLPEISGDCPGTEIDYLSDIASHILMEGKASVNEGWDSDQYIITPGTEGLMKIHYKADHPISLKVDYVCGTIGKLYRKAGGGALKEGSIDVPVSAEQSVYINAWDWESGSGYPYDLDIEFIPSDDNGDATDDNNTTENGDNNDGADNNDTGATDGTDNTVSDVMVYEDAEDGDINGWVNISPYIGTVSNIAMGDNRVIQLSGTTDDAKNRASYSFGENWNNTKDFIAKWDMQSDTDYEVFFIAKSSDDPTIVNYIGYVNQVPVLNGYTFDPSAGYWSEDATGDTLKSWGRYVYTPIDDTHEMTTITRDLKEDASVLDGVELTSIESMWVNVYGDSTKSVILDNITLQATQTPVENHIPHAEDQNITVNEGESVTITLTGTDSDGDNLVYEIVTQPAQGTLSGEAPNITYVAGSVEANTIDTFTFKVKDDQNESNIATVTVTIVDVPEVVNQAPVAEDINISVDQNETVAITLTASDSEGAALTYHLNTDSLNGTLTGTAPDLTYRPGSDFNGTDTFRYYVSDGDLNSSLATVTITVNAVEVPDENNETNTSSQIININENGSIDFNCAGQMIDTPEANQTVEIHGALSGQWDNDQYSFVMPEESAGILKATAVDSDGNPLKVQVIRNCFRPLPESDIGYPVGGEDCHLVTVVVYGCAKDEDVEYTLTLKMAE